MNSSKLTSLATVALMMVGCSTNSNTTAPDTRSSSEQSSSQSSSSTIQSRQDTVFVDYKGTAPLATYFRISDGKKTQVALDAWDLAISTTNGAIISNAGLYGTNVRVFKTAESDLAVNQTSLTDSVTQFSDSLTNPFDAETRRSSVYLIKDAAGVFYKVIFASIDPIAHTYSIEFTTGLAGTATTTINGDLAVDMDRAYLDLRQGKDVSALIPKKTEWDILFTRALEFSMGPQGIGATSAILMNSETGADAAIVAQPFDSVTSVYGVDFVSGVDAIGSKWYLSNYDMVNHISTVTVPVQTFVVRTHDLQEAKLQLLTFYGPESQSFYTVFRSALLQ